MLTRLQRLVAVMMAAVTVTVMATAATTPTSKSWFQEKYIQETYVVYYEYMLTRYELGDNDRDVCPDIHKSSTIFAITGQHITRITKTCSSPYAKKKPAKVDLDQEGQYAQYAQYAQYITGIMTSIIEFIGEFICYTFEITMLILSIILASCSTLFMIILMFCQY
jgi:hypothetical protein